MFIEYQKIKLISCTLDWTEMISCFIKIRAFSYIKLMVEKISNLNEKATLQNSSKWIIYIAVTILIEIYTNPKDPIWRGRKS